MKLKPVPKNKKEYIEICFKIWGCVPVDTIWAQKTELYKREQNRISSSNEGYIRGIEYKNAKFVDGGILLENGEFWKREDHTPKENQNLMRRIRNSR